MSFKLTTSSFLGIVLIVVAGYLTLQVHLLSKSRQNIQFSLAEINSIRYGMLNDRVWNTAIGGLLSEKLADLDFDNANRALIESSVEGLLNYLVRDMDRLINPAGTNQENWLQQAITTIAFDLAFDTAMLKKQVPIITDEIIRRLEEEETQLQLKSFLQDRLTGIIQVPKTKSEEPQLALIRELGCEDVASCSSNLSNKSDQLQSQIQRQTSLIALCSGLLLLFCFSFKDPRQLYPLLGMSIILLAGGLTVPMIDIDARIEELSFNLMGQEMVFRDQVLFFQSKSILEVVDLLITNGGGQTMLVGALILTFSVLFPFSKIIATTIALSRSDQKPPNGLINLLIFKSGKWSMADVMVVAIFMAFIGFQGILNSQLDQLQNISPSMNIITTHKYTSLQAGFYLFTGFCLLSLIISAFYQELTKEK